MADNFNPDKYLSDFNPDEYLTQEELKSEAPSVLESGARGLAQGATLGFADEGTAALETLWEKAKGDPTAFGELYKKAREESRQAYKLAEETNPTAFGAGELGGAIGTAFIPGVGAARGAKLASVIGRSALEGGLAGLGTSEAETVGEDVTSTLGGAALGTLGGGLGVLGGKALTKAGQKISGAGEEAAEKLAFSRLGGTKTKTGAELYGKELRDIYESGITSPREIGRKALDEDLLGTLGLKSSQEIQESAGKSFEKALGEQSEFLRRPDIASEKLSLEDIFNEYQQLVGKKAIKGTEQGEAALGYLSRDKGRFQTLKDVDLPEEDLLTDIERFSKLEDPKIAQEKVFREVSPELAEKMKRIETPELNIKNKGKISGKNLAKQAKRQSLMEAVEDVVKKTGGEDLLSQFKGLKKTSGEAGIIKDMTTEQLEKEAKRGDSIGGSVKGLLMDSLLGRTKGVGAKALDVGSKTIGKAAEKATPAGTALGLGIAAQKSSDLNEQDAIEDQQRRVSELLNTYTTTKNEKLSDVYEKDINKYMSGTDRDKAAAEYKLLQNPYIRQKLKLNEQE